jgi:iron-sulfur cluster repair protein YtfE (RIC family)
MDPTAILHSDHQKFITLFSQIEHASPDERRELYLRLELILTLHMLSEERIFYQELLNQPDVADVIKKSYQSHHLVDVATHELKTLSYTHEQWLPKFQAIRDNILTHMAEEENLLFPMLKVTLSETQLMAIGDKMLDYRRHLIA